MGRGSREIAGTVIGCELLTQQEIRRTRILPARRLLRTNAIANTFYLRRACELQARLCEHLAAAGEEDDGPRLLAGSTADMPAEVQAGRLLEEFHCLLSPLTIAVPPLPMWLVSCLRVPSNVYKPSLVSP